MTGRAYGARTSVAGEPLAPSQRDWAPLISRTLAWAALPLTFIGMGISAYLSFVHLNGVPLYCEGSGGCHTVQSSEYATLLGAPVAALGFVLYTAISAMSLAGMRNGGRLAEVAPFLVFGLALSGVLYSGYLT